MSSKIPEGGGGGFHFLAHGLLVIPGIVSIDHVHCQSKSITIYHEAYAVDTLKVEIEVVKVEK